MEVTVFDVPMLVTKITWLMMESITTTRQWILMKICLVVFVFLIIIILFFAFLINNVNIKPRHCSVAPDRMKRCYRQPYRVISADWSNNIWNVTGVSFFFFFKCCSSPVFLLRWVNTRSKWSLSSDITCQSRQEKCSLKVTLLWCLYSACHYIFHFLWAKIYNLSFDRRSKHL